MPAGAVFVIARSARGAAVVTVAVAWLALKSGCSVLVATSAASLIEVPEAAPDANRPCTVAVSVSPGARLGAEQVAMSASTEQAARGAEALSRASVSGAPVASVTTMFRASDGPRLVARRVNVTMPPGVTVSGLAVLVMTTPAAWVIGTLAAATLLSMEGSGVSDITVATLVIEESVLAGSVDATMVIVAVAPAARSPSEQDTVPRPAGGGL